METNCIYCRFCFCITDHSKINGLKQQESWLDSHSFCGSGVWEWFSWVVLTQGLSGSFCQVLAGATVTWRLDSGQRIRIQGDSLLWLANQCCLLVGGLGSFPYESFSFWIERPRGIGSGFPQDESFERPRNSYTAFQDSESTLALPSVFRWPHGASLIHGEKGQL